ncbi:MAG: hypothetical protein ACE5J1_02485 [Nitrospiria bacterium]
MKLRFVGQCLVASSLIYAAYILGTMVQEVRQIRAVLPELLTRIEGIEQSAQIPEILQQTQQVLADTEPWLIQVKAMNDHVPAILQEAAATRAMIPPVLKESAQIREQLDRQLPLVLHQMETAQALVPDVLQRLDTIEALVPDVLKEVKAVRNEAPKLLDKADSIVHKAERIYEKVGEDTATGVLKGIISLPQKALKSGAEKIEETLTGKKSKEKDK